jgi:hypothetical protein
MGSTGQVSPDVAGRMRPRRWLSRCTSRGHPAAGGHHGPWVWSLTALARNADRLPRPVHAGGGRFRCRHGGPSKSIMAAYQLYLSRFTDIVGCYRRPRPSLPHRFRRPWDAPSARLGDCPSFAIQLSGRIGRRTWSKPRPSIGRGEDVLHRLRGVLNSLLEVTGARYELVGT